MKANDSIDKLFFKRKDIVAEMINVGFGGGRTLVRPEDVEFIETEYIVAVKDRDDKVISKKRIRDIMCNISGVDLGGRKFRARFGLECQSYQTRLMPLRAAEYDCMDFIEQKRGVWCGKGRRRRFIPCYTLVINTSGRPWKRPTSLGSLCEYRPDFLVGFLLSYNMLLFDLFNIPPEIKKLLCTDLKYVVHCIDLMGDPVKLLDYITNGLPKDLAEETANFICRIVNIEIPDNCKIPRNEGETTVCYAARVWRKEAMMAGWKEGRAEGKIEGRAEGKIEGRAENRQVVFRNAIKLGLSQESIQSLLNISADEYMRLLAL